MPQSVNLANVDISLAQFQEISSGKYNAGEVALSGRPRSSRSTTTSG